MSECQTKAGNQECLAKLAKPGKKIFLGSRILFESRALIVHLFQVQTTFKYFNTSLFNLYSVKTFKMLSECDNCDISTQQLAADMARQ